MSKLDTSNWSELMKFFHIDYLRESSRIKADLMADKIQREAMGNIKDREDFWGKDGEINISKYV